MTEAEIYELIDDITDEIGDRVLDTEELSRAESLLVMTGVVSWCDNWAQQLEREIGAR